jgi:superoxide reductase
MAQKFYFCQHCGNIIAKDKDSGVLVICCGEKMTELVSSAVDVSLEKHVPIYTLEGNASHVKIGSAEHPMLPKHYIERISLPTKQENQRKELHPGEQPEACFAHRVSDEVEAVYACCNLHGLRA